MRRRRRRRRRRRPPACLPYQPNFLSYSFSPSISVLCVLCLACPA
jgi:hypothetical protein